MKKLTLSIIIFAFWSSTAMAQKVFDKTFKVVEKVSISTVSGNCLIKKGGGDEIKVHLSHTYNGDCFSYKIKERNGSLEIEEKFKGRFCSGQSNWEITLPENTEIKFNTASGGIEINSGSKVDINTASGNIKINAGDEVYINTASGDMKLSGLNGKIKINSASGDINLVSSKAELKINTASGNVKAEGLSGVVNINTASGDIGIDKSSARFSVNSASGNIKASGVVIKAESEFTSASGNVVLGLEKSTAFDLTLSSASGNSVLDYNGNSLNGYYEFTARVKKGHIVSPIKFDKEEIIEKRGKKYDVKSFTKGKSSPVVLIKTASGVAKLLK